MENREYYLNFLQKHNLSVDQLAKLTTFNRSGLYEKKAGDTLKDSFIVLLKYMDKVKELTGEFLGIGE